MLLSRADVDLALSDMHLQNANGCLPPSLLSPATTVDVTDLVTVDMLRMVEVHPIFAFMAEQTTGNDDFHESVYFGTTPRGPDAIAFPALCRRLVASIYVFEALIGQNRDAHRQLAQHYESAFLAAASERRAGPPLAPRSLRHALMGAFLALKGESVLASINTFEQLRRTSATDTGEVSRLSSVLNSIMRLNLVEAVLSNLSFAFWPDNARAGMALLLAPLPPFQADLSQPLDPEWYRLYLAWNANFIWPSHFSRDMLCFTMLLTPTIALGSSTLFQYHRAHTLFWVVRSTQLTRLDEATALATGAPGAPPSDQIPCFHCRQLSPETDRQPLTSRTAVETRASGERLARGYGADVSPGSGVWWRLATEVVPEQARSLAAIFGDMPKARGRSAAADDAPPWKLRLL